MKSISICTLILCVLCVLCFAGCGKNIKAIGTVKFDDGTPLTTGTVTFQSNLLYSGNIASDGTFQLGGTKEGSGLPPGSYKVSVEAYNGTTPLVAEKYLTAQSSGLTVDVSDNNRNIEIVVERPEAKKPTS